MSQETRDEFALPEWADQIETVAEQEHALDQTITMEFEDGTEPLSVTRRDFLRVASAAAAATGLATAAGCRPEADKIVPYVKRPEEVYHGVPNTFTSVYRGESRGEGILMTVREGRVTKLEGNPDHPVNRGRLSGRAQASVLNLYDMARVRGALKGDGGESSWEELDKAISGAFKKGGAIRILTRPLGGPGERKLVEALESKYSDLGVVEWEPMARNAAALGNEKAYSTRFLPHYRLDKALSIVAFGSDFADDTEYARQFASTRDPDKEMSRLTAFESRMSSTGAAADLRHPVAPNDLLYAALAVANELILGGNIAPLANDPNVRAALKGHSADTVGKALGLDPKVFKDAAANLKKAGKRGVAVTTREGNLANGSQIEIVAALINEALGSIGTTVEHKAVAFSSNFGDFKNLIGELASGKVNLLIVHGLNPVYDAPASLKFTEAMAKAKTSVVVDTYQTETTAAAQYLAGESHYLESWGDTNPTQGVYSLQQPGLQPLHDTRTFLDHLLVWTKGQGVEGAAEAHKANASFKDEFGRKGPGAWHFYLKNFWTTEMHKAVRSPMKAERFWEDVLRKGVLVTKDAHRSKRHKFNSGALKGIPGTRPASEGDQIELFAPAGVYDGRFADNPMLQELPDPIARTSWGNYVGIGAKRFTEMGLKQGSIIKVTAGDASIELPATMMPGLPANTVAVPLGYGRTKVGVVARDLGASGFALAGSNDEGIIYNGVKVSISATGAWEELGMPKGLGQVLHNVEGGRYLVPVTDIASYKKDNAAGAPRDHHPGIWETHKYEGLRWGMTIDLSKCTACGACAVACHVENNVPVVGKQGVIEGRLMQWLRIDRYYALPGGLEKDYTEQLLTEEPEVAAAEYLENPLVLIQPILCQHCLNAPCETVCPVAATMHSTEGINEQVYNRCVGTRYCANNCPYKVRRFNWYSYSSDRSQEFLADIFPELIDIANYNAKWPAPLRFNPEVTVRVRGVMEKCSFCVQRLAKATKVFRKRGLMDAEPIVACQQTCPSEAISFGNLLDEKTEVAQKFNSKRAFALIEHVGTKPSVHYLTRVRNVDVEA